MSNQHSSENEGLEGSDLLAELAGEATQKSKTLQFKEQDRQERIRKLHEALSKIVQYFSQLSSHLNKIEPTVPRTYNVDPLTTKTNFKWSQANVDSRKQSLTDNALIDHVSMRVKLSATSPLLVKRRWNELDKLKTELDDLGLSVSEDMNTQVRKQPQQDFFQIELTPDILMRIQFRGEYDTGKIDILSNNFDGFGLAAYSLDPTDVSQTLLDEVGRFLIGRTDKLPEILSKTRFTPEHPIYR